MDVNKASTANINAILSSFVHNKKEYSTAGANQKSSDGCGQSSQDFQAFHTRVQSFTTLTWFAKPAWLSPPNCARYGWHNVGENMLQCVTCRAFLDGTLPSALRPKTYGECCKRLKDSLTTSHHRYCRWKTNPSPESFLQVEVPDLADFKNRVLDLVEFGTRLPKIEEDVFTNMKLNGEMFERIQARLDLGTCCDYEVFKAACVLAVCGWNKWGEQFSPVLSCKYCSREAGLWNYFSLNGCDTDISDEEEEVVPFKKKSCSTDDVLDSSMDNLPEMSKSYINTPDVSMDETSDERDQRNKQTGDTDVAVVSNTEEHEDMEQNKCETSAQNESESLKQSENSCDRGENESKTQAQVLLQSAALFPKVDGDTKTEENHRENDTKGQSSPVMANKATDENKCIESYCKDDKNGDSTSVDVGPVDTLDSTEIALDRTDDSPSTSDMRQAEDKSCDKQDAVQEICSAQITDRSPCDMPGMDQVKSDMTSVADSTSEAQDEVLGKDSKIDSIPHMSDASDTLATAVVDSVPHTSDAHDTNLGVADMQDSIPSTLTVPDTDCGAFDVQDPVPSISENSVPSSSYLQTAFIGTTEVQGMVQATSDKSSADGESKPDVTSPTAEEACMQLGEKGSGKDICTSSPRQTQKEKLEQQVLRIIRSKQQQTFQSATEDKVETKPEIDHQVEEREEPEELEKPRSADFISDEEGLNDSEILEHLPEADVIDDVDESSEDEVVVHDVSDNSNNNNSSVLVSGETSSEEDEEAPPAGGGHEAGNVAEEIDLEAESLGEDSEEEYEDNDTVEDDNDVIDEDDNSTAEAVSDVSDNDADSEDDEELDDEDAPDADSVIDEFEAIADEGDFESETSDDEDDVDDENDDISYDEIQPQYVRVPVLSNTNRNNPNNAIVVIDSSSEDEGAEEDEEGAEEEEEIDQEDVDGGAEEGNENVDIEDEEVLQVMDASDIANESYEREEEIEDTYTEDEPSFEEENVEFSIQPTQIVEEPEEQNQVDSFSQEESFQGQDNRSFHHLGESDSQGQSSQSFANDDVDLEVNQNPKDIGNDEEGEETVDAESEGGGEIGTVDELHSDEGTINEQNSLNDQENKDKETEQIGSWAYRTDLQNVEMKVDGAPSMTEIQNTSQASAECEYVSVDSDVDIENDAEVSNELYVTANMTLENDEIPSDQEIDIMEENDTLGEVDDGEAVCVSVSREEQVIASEVQDVVDGSFNLQNGISDVKKDSGGDVEVDFYSGTNQIALHPIINDNVFLGPSVSANSLASSDIESNPRTPFSRTDSAVYISGNLSGISTPDAQFSENSQTFSQSDFEVHAQANRVPIQNDNDIPMAEAERTPEASDTGSVRRGGPVLTPVDLKRKRKSRKSPFNPLTEHRKWCPWVNCAEDLNTKHKEGKPGWELVLEALLQEQTTSKEANLNVSDLSKTSPGYEGLRRVQHLFDGWASQLKGKEC